MFVIFKRYVIVIISMIMLTYLCQLAFTNFEIDTAQFRVGIQDSLTQKIKWLGKINQHRVCYYEGQKCYFDQWIAQISKYNDQALICEIKEGNEIKKKKLYFNEQGASIDGLQMERKEALSILRQWAKLEGVEEAKAVSIQDVMNMPMEPVIIEKTDFPRASYHQAFPKAEDEAALKIESFSESPNIVKRQALANTDRRYLPTMDPVEKRLPLIPCVARGFDGIGSYGGVLRQAWNNTVHLTRQLGHESFIRFDPKGRIVPSLAYKWDISEDLKTYTFYLRPGHRWSDGAPFTAEDLTYVTNEVIGGAAWSMPPQWMQPVDGMGGFTSDDITDAQGLALTLLNGKDQPGPARQVWTLLSKPLLNNEMTEQQKQKILAQAQLNEKDIVKAIQKLSQDGSDQMSRQQLAIGLMNVVRHPDFYIQDQWPTIPELNANPEFTALLDMKVENLGLKEKNRIQILMERDRGLKLVNSGKKLGSTELPNFNNLMLRAAFPKFITKAHRYHCHVTAHQDAWGTPSIVKFSFEKPNPMFLEQTATFMFYRGLFETPAHIFRALNPRSDTDISINDILDWDQFIQALATNQSEILGVAAHIKNLLSEKTQELITDQKTNWDIQNKTSLIYDINRVLSSHAFFEQKLFESIPLSPLSDLIKLKTRFRLNFEEKNLIQTVLRRNQLLQQALAGRTPLKTEEISILNRELFRLSFGKTIVYETKEAALNAVAKNCPEKYISWELYQRHLYRDSAWEKPTLKAWKVISNSDETPTHYAVRNPYYYRVDSNGQQLPYIDEIQVALVTKDNARLLKMTTGNIDFQIKGLRPEHFSLLKKNEDAGDYDILRWAGEWAGQMIIIFPQSRLSPKMANLQSHPEFRKAVSMCINRQEMIDIIWGGLSEPYGAAVPEGSPFYNERLAHEAIQYNPKKANLLLDQLGYHRGQDGMRCFPDGSPILIDLYGDAGVNVAPYQMICNYMQKVGINAQLKVAAGGRVGRMLSLGNIDAIVRLDYGPSFFGPLMAGFFAPTHPAETQQWSTWVTWMHTNGASGMQPPAWFFEKNLFWNAVQYAPSRHEMIAAWQKLMEHTSEHLPNIGISTSPGQLVYKKRGLMNVPKLALAGWISHAPANCNPENFYWAPDHQE